MPTKLVTLGRRRPYPTEALAEADCAAAAFRHVISAIDRRNPPAGRMRDSDRGSQLAAERYRDLLTVDGCDLTCGPAGDRRDMALN
jgi:hypothetical protein